MSAGGNYVRSVLLLGWKDSRGGLFEITFKGPREDTPDHERLEMELRKALAYLVSRDGAEPEGSNPEDIW